MVFGWGKKREENRITPDTPTQISLSEIPPKLKKIFEEKESHTVAAIRSIRDQTKPLIKELQRIGETLEKDDLRVDDIDKNIRIIVVRGKRQVISTIKKDVVPLPEIKSYGDADDLNSILNQMLKKIGDVLGRQTRVIHIFAKKYAEKLKDLLLQLNSNHKEIQDLLARYKNMKSINDEIFFSLEEIKKFENNISNKKERLIELKSLNDSLEKQILSNKTLIKKFETSDEYKQYLEFNKTLDDCFDKKNQIKNNINSQFTKISRPLSRYVYTSSLDKDQQSLLAKLIEDPFDVLYPKNKDSIIIILENVRRGISSGSISVKDLDKSFSQITEMEEMLAELIRNATHIRDEIEKVKKNRDSMKPRKLFDLNSEIENANSERSEVSEKINTFNLEIEEDKSRLSNLIDSVDSKLKSFSNNAYSFRYL